MKLYDSQLAPNPRRVRIFLAEKGVEVDIVAIDIMKGEHKKPEYRAISPQALLPALELDDGAVLTETVAICRYFEELVPDPHLMGVTPLEKAQIEMWQRRMELTVFLPIGMVFRHTHPAMAALEDQCADWGESNRSRAEKSLRWLNKELADRPFIAGDNYSIADITALVGVDFGKLSDIHIDEDYKNLLRWHGEVSSRPSAKA